MRSWLHLFTHRRMLIVLLLGFCSGLPLALIGSTLQAWMVSSGVDLTLIGVFSLVSLPYTLKFLWAPLMDRFVPPFLGRRRGWIILTQLGVMISLLGMAMTQPDQSPAQMAWFAFLVAFGGASQDIVVDAYRTEVLEPKEYGVGSATGVLGYRLAMLFSGAVALILADHLPWKMVYLLMAVSLVMGPITCLFAPEPPARVLPPRSLREAVIEPLSEFFHRRGSWEILSFIILYKLDVVVTMALMTPFILGLGFTKTDLGTVTKGFGLVATIAGTFTGGIWLSRLGIHRSLWVFGILQGISGLCFYILSLVGYHYPMMVVTIAAENFFSGMGNAAYSAFLMSLCHPRFTATQFALLTSMMALTRTVVGSPTGWLVQSVGWSYYYLIALLLAIPSLLLLLRFKKWETLIQHHHSSS